MEAAVSARTPLIVGNWKMNKTVAEAEEFIQALLPRVATADGVEAAVATHRSQAEIYAAATGQTTGLAVAEVVFVFCRVGLEGVCRWE